MRSERPEGAEQGTPDGVRLPGTYEELVRPSSSGGSPFRILVGRPSEPPPPDGYPIVYLLDGAAYFGTLVEMIRLRRNRPAMTAIDPTVVVGIAHPGAHPYDRVRRQHEYAPDPEGEPSLRRFLVDDLQEWVRAAYPVDRDRSALVGHSLAGSFVLETLLSEPAAYGAYCAISPSIWARRETIAEGLSRAEPRSSEGERPSRLFVSVAEYDQAVAPWQRRAPEQEDLRRRREERGMVDEARAFCRKVEELFGDRAAVRFTVSEGDDHASVVPVALSRSLRFLVGSETSSDEALRPGVGP